MITTNLLGRRASITTTNAVTGAFQQLAGTIVAVESHELKTANGTDIAIGSRLRAWIEMPTGEVRPVDFPSSWRLEPQDHAGEVGRIDVEWIPGVGLVARERRAK